MESCEREEERGGLEGEAAECNEELVSVVADHSVVQTVELEQCEPLLLLLTMRGDVKARWATRDWVVAAVRVIVAVMVSSELSKSRLRRVCTRYRQLCADRMNVVHGERGAG